MSENNTTPNPFGILAIGCSLLACLVLLIMGLIFGAVYREQLPIIQNYFPTATAVATATPSLLITPAAKNTFILKEDFTTNKNDWGSYYRNQKVEVKDGKLFLESFYDGSIGIAHCYCKAPISNQFGNKFYYQVDVSTEKPTNQSYGLAFSLTPKKGYYIFTITNNRSYALDIWAKDHWENLRQGKNEGMIRPYPASNTLSVSFDDGDIELYINDMKITSYHDPAALQEGQIGLYVNGGNFKLIADNLFVYSK